MSSVMEIRIRNSKKAEKDFKSRIQTISFPDRSEILSDTIQEQMMMDGYAQTVFILLAFCSNKWGF